jgi:amicyanin
MEAPMSHKRKINFPKGAYKQMKKTIFSLALASLVVLPFALLNSGHTELVAGERNSPADQHQVKIDNFSYAPSALTVPLGATVTWINQDDVPHNVVSTEGNTLKSSLLDTDQKFSYRFDKAGTYPYYCSIHPKMIGKVIVQ